MPAPTPTPLPATACTPPPVQPLAGTFAPIELAGLERDRLRAAALASAVAAGDLARAEDLAAGTALRVEPPTGVPRDALCALLLAHAGTLPFEGAPRREAALACATPRHPYTQRCLGSPDTAPAARLRDVTDAIASGRARAGDADCTAALIGGIRTARERGDDADRVPVALELLARQGVVDRGTVATLVLLDARALLPEALGRATDAATRLELHRALFTSLTHHYGRPEELAAERAAIARLDHDGARTRAALVQEVLALADAPRVGAALDRALLSDRVAVLERIAPDAEETWFARFVRAVLDPRPDDPARFAREPSGGRLRYALAYARALAPSARHDRAGALDVLGDVTAWPAGETRAAAHWLAAALAEQAGDEAAMARELSASLDSLTALPVQIADLRSRFDNTGTMRLLQYYAGHGECAQARAWRARWQIREGCGLAALQIVEAADCVVASCRARP